MGEGEWRKKHDKYLIIRLATVDRNENAQIVEAIKRYWEQIGIKTEVKVFPVSVIQSEVIRERNFDSLFYGQVVGSDPDPYAFWHSSQTGDEGFNIANFVNKEVDELLEDARLVADQNERKEKYFRFQEIIAEEVPAIFMYSPLYTYMQSGNVKGFAVRDILLPRDRFANVEEWYLRTGQKLIWPKNN
jgi:peptide/nickel transport system substrate-binding protein